MTHLDDPPPDFRLLRFSTDVLPAPDRFEMWRDTLSRKLFHATIDSLADRPFQARASLRAQHGLRIAGGVTAASIHRHTQTQARADNDDVMLLINVKGPLLVTQRGAEFELGEGDGALITCAEPTTMVRPEPGRIICVRLPYAQLGALAPRLDGAIARRLLRRTDPLALLTGYVFGLQDDDEMAVSPGASRLVVQHILDLTALMIGVGADSAAFAAGRGVRTARLRALKSYIREHLPTVGIDGAAVAHGISVRYVRRLFEDEGMTFSDYVIEQRVGRVHAALLSPRSRERSIATLAFEVGFNDLSHFNRVFRRRYHATPREIRAAALLDHAAAPAPANGAA